MFSLERTTLTEYLISQRRSHPGATGEFNALILQVAQACKAISRAVAHGALAGVLGALDATNVQGETQQTLDVPLLAEHPQRGARRGARRASRTRSSRR